MPRRVTWATALALACLLPGCRREEPAPVPTPDVVVHPAATLPSDPADPAWQAAPEHVAALLLQDVVEPRLMKPSTAEVRVRALSDGKRLAFRLQWTDPTQDDQPTSNTFTDACAVQLPARIEATLPSPQMGEPDHPVEIAFWTAAWQAAADGRPVSLGHLYPHATSDHYPFEAPSLKPDSPERQAMATRYAPARSLGNLVAGPGDQPVQDLVAEGPGTLAPAPETTSEAHGQRTENGWAVVISRPLPPGFSSHPQAQVALAIWQGSEGEAASRKMRTGWIGLTRAESNQP